MPKGYKKKFFGFMLMENMYKFINFMFVLRMRIKVSHKVMLRRKIFP